MKRKIALLLAASLIAAAGLSGASYAKGGGNGNGGGHGSGGSGHGSHSASGNTHSASSFAPGRTKAAGENATAYAPGRIKQKDESAAAYAPGKVKKATEETAAVIDEPVTDDDATAGSKVNFGTLISSIRASKTSLEGVDETTAVSVVDVDDLMQGNNRVALENALADNQDQITDLRADLTALALPDLQSQDVEQTVGIAKAKDGSLTVFVDRDQ